eukprot:195469-Pyramimonas_sp.AAC.1
MGSFNVEYRAQGILEALGALHLVPRGTIWWIRQKGGRVRPTCEAHHLVRARDAQLVAAHQDAKMVIPGPAA